LRLPFSSNVANLLKGAAICGLQGTYRSGRAAFYLERLASNRDLPPDLDDLIGGKAEEIADMDRVALHHEAASSRPRDGSNGSICSRSARKNIQPRIVFLKASFKIRFS